MERCLMNGYRRRCCIGWILVTGASHMNKTGHRKVIVLTSLRCAALADMALIYDRLKDGPPSDNSLETRSYKDEKKQ